MTSADGFRTILPGVLVWSAYSPEHRVELSSTAARASTGWWIFDPIPLAGGDFLSADPIAGIVLTNENHERAADRWQVERNAEIWAAPEAQLSRLPARRWSLAGGAFPDWKLWPLTGGAGGETLWFLAERSLMIFGDAVVNLANRGLELLPDKYCRDPRQLRDSLRRLPPFENAVFAHGEPLLGAASRRIAALL